MFPGSATGRRYHRRVMQTRRTPEDFVVIERLSDGFSSGLTSAWTAGTTHAVYRLRKTSLTTPEAVSKLARLLGVRAGAVAWAGLKDKHAATTQHVTTRYSDARAAGAAPRNLAGPGCSAELIGFAPSEIAADAIAFNRFLIVVRRMQRRDFGMTDQRARALTDPSVPSPALLVVNYFGDQRFGSARHGEGFAARHLIRADFESALKLLVATPDRKDTGTWRAFTRACAARWGDWSRLLAELPRRPERAAIETLAGGGSMRDAFSALPPFTQQMCVEAYQSLLWNSTARRLSAMITPRCVRAGDDFGEMLFPPAGALDESWRALRIPMLAPGVAMHQPWGHAAEGVLGEEGITTDDLAIPGLRRPAFGASQRPFLAAATDFAVGVPEPDELSPGTNLWKRTLSFDLPRGAYATVVLRALGA